MIHSPVLLWRWRGLPHFVHGSWLSKYIWWLSTGYLFRGLPLLSVRMACRASCSVLYLRLGLSNRLRQYSETVDFVQLHSVAISVSDLPSVFRCLISCTVESGSLCSIVIVPNSAKSRVVYRYRMCKAPIYCLIYTCRWCHHLLSCCFLPCRISACVLLCLHRAVFVDKGNTHLFQPSHYPFALYHSGFNPT